MDNNGVKAYYTSVTEFEAGWGQRHSGFIIALSKENLNKGINFVNNNGDYSLYFRNDNEGKICFISQKMADSIKEYRWTDDKKATWLIEE